MWEIIPGNPMMENTLKISKIGKHWEILDIIYLILLLICFMPPTLKKWGHIGFGLSVCMYGASRFRLETSCMDSSWKKIADILSWNYHPLLNHCLLKEVKIKFCKCHISKSIKA